MAKTPHELLLQFKNNYEAILKHISEVFYNKYRDVITDVVVQGQYLGFSLAGFDFCIIARYWVNGEILTTTFATKKINSTPGIPDAVLVEIGKPFITVLDDDYFTKNGKLTIDDERFPLQHGGDFVDTYVATLIEHIHRNYQQKQ